MSSVPKHRGEILLIPGLLASIVLTMIVAVALLRSVPTAPVPGPDPRFAARTALRTGPSLAERALRLTQPAMRPVGSVAVPAPVPRWIWTTAQASPDQRAWLRRTERTDPAVRRAMLRFSADNHAIVRVNGAEVARSDDWSQPGAVDLTEAARSGEIEVVIEARNDAGPAGVVALLEIVEPDGARRWVPTDAGWQAADDEAFAEPAAATDLGPLGSSPWGGLPLVPGSDLDRALAVVAGFDVELVYAVPREQGSWVCLTADDRGRLLASDQRNGLYRIEPGPAGTGAERTVVEPIEPTPGGAQGLLVLGDDLYVVVNVGGPDGPGLYRMRDLDGDDRYDETRLLRAIPGGTGEHGAHAVVLGPDGMLYVAGGNHTPLPDPERSAVPRVWGEDHLLPRLWDANGHAVGIMAPGGWICRTDSDGRSWELLASGFRNAYDLDFNADGELFTYDADMEWDMGAPWYRPTRVYHVASGAEFGWRSGTAKWPAYYPDGLPPVLDVGPGSPTGVVSGRGSAFPPRYRDALFILDWTYGTIFAVHLEPDGASYRATRETFLTGQPLPLADAVIGPADGAMYVVVGGRGLASAVYRIRWTGETPAPPQIAPIGAVAEAAAARERRRRLEVLHRDDAAPGALEALWPALGDPDRFVRYAARVALEHQPIERWADRALAEDRPRAALAALLAMARVGGPDRAEPLARALEAIGWTELDRAGRLELLRCWALRLIRGGGADEALAARLVERFEPLYPSGDEATDRELCDLLVFLGSPQVVAKTIPLMERRDDRTELAIEEDLLARSDAYGQVILQMASARPQQQQIHYALALRNAEEGWTGPLRRRYFQWFETAARTRGGLSFAGFLANIRADALARVPSAERERYATIGRYERADPDPATRPHGPGRSWTTPAVVELARDGLTFRDHERGAQLFRGAMCAQCHRFAGTGLAGGPDLTGVASRFTLPDLVETIIEPSRAVSDQYAQTELLLDDGRVVLGRLVDETDDVVRLRPSQLEPDALVEVAKSSIVGSRRSDVSPMLPFLLDGMAPGEVLDLLAYLLSGGDPRSPLFGPPDAGPWREAFDGRTLEGWTGDRGRWTIEDRCIMGRTTAERPLDRNVFLVLTEPLPPDFELRAEVRLDGGNNSGIQYRSRVDPGGVVSGYQCDIHPNADYDGMVYEEGGRGIMAEHGQRLRWSARGRRYLLGPEADPVVFDRDAWHEYTVIALGNRLEHRIDGTVTSIVIDEQHPAGSGNTVAVQLHAGAAYEVRFRKVRWRSLDSSQLPNSPIPLTRIVR